MMVEVREEVLRRMVFYVKEFGVNVVVNVCFVILNVGLSVVEVYVYGIVVVVEKEE